MFRSARIKLTAWYLLILMSVSIAFSGVIYRMFTWEFDRFARIQRYRIEHRFEILPFDLPPASINDEPFVTEAKQHLLFILSAVNIGVFVIAGGLGYFLAGRTLMPISDMIDEQNRFISDASHELRTPLTALKSSLEVNLRDKKLSIADAKNIIRDGILDVNKLQSLTDALLQLAQYQTPKTHVTFSQIQLTQIIHHAFQRMTPIAKQKHISLEYSSPSISFRAYEYGLSDLLVILLDNAIKYSPQNTIITVSAQHDNGHVIISVTDHGAGISEKDLPHIFDRFYRADIARSKQSTGGYGLGLSIAKQIVNLHHGTISVESHPNKNTIFIVRLPKRQSHTI